MPLRHNEASFSGPLAQKLDALCGEKEYFPELQLVKKKF